MWSVEPGVRSNTGKCLVQDLQYKVVLCRTVWTLCSTARCSRFFKQECVTKVFQSIERECFTRVCHKSVEQECQARVSDKSVPEKCPTKECPTQLSEKSVKQECSARVVCNAIEHLLFAFPCSVGTLLLRELFVASIMFS